MPFSICILISNLKALLSDKYIFQDKAFPFKVFFFWGGGAGRGTEEKEGKFTPKKF